MVDFYLDQGNGKILKAEVPNEKAGEFLRKALGIPDDYQPPPLPPEEQKRLERCRAGICLGLSSLVYAMKEDKPFDRDEYISLASETYDVPKDNLIRVLEVGEEIFGKENHLKLIDYVGLYFEGENHKVDGKTCEETAKQFKDMREGKYKEE